MNLQSLSNDDLVALYQRAGAPSPDRVTQGFEDAAAMAPQPSLQSAMDRRFEPSPGNALASAPASPPPKAAGSLDLSSLSDDDLRALHRQSAGKEGDGLGYNLAAGLNDALYRTAGAPVDAATWLINKGIGGVNAATGAELPEIRDPIGGSQSIANAFGAIGVRDPASVQAATPAERIARGVGEGIGYTVAPQAAVGGLVQAGALPARAVQATAPFLGSTESLPAVAGNALAGGAAGGGARAAMEAVPDPYKPIAGLAGGLAGAGVGSLVAGVPSLAKEGTRLAGDTLAPLTQAGRERIAGQQLREAATDAPAAISALQDPATLVPGSKPTTFQQTGDMGLGALERSVAARNPAEFMQRRADQNTARVSALQGVEPAGYPEAITSALRSRLGEIDRETDTALQFAMTQARDHARGLGGSGSQEATGDTLRTMLRTAESNAREKERALWKAVDPEDTLALGTTSIKDSAANIRKSMPNTAKPMEGEEKAIFDVAAKLPGAIKFGAMSALRSRVTTLMRQEMMTNGQTPVYHRLSQLRGAIERDVEGVLADRVQREAQAVAAGAMREEDTIAAAINRWKSAWTARAEAETGTFGGAGDSRYAAGGAPGVSGVRGTASKAGIGPSGAPSDPGLSPDAGLSPNFDAAAQARLKAASEATRARAQTYSDGQIGSILRRQTQDGPYALSAAVVPEKLFFQGGRSAEAIRRFREAVGDPAAMDTLAEYAVTQARKAAETADGIIDPKRLDIWRRRHADALKAFPALDARLADAGRLAQAAIETGARRAEQLDAFQKGAIGRLIGAEDPADVVRIIGGLFSRQDSAAQIAKLARLAANDPEARQGLRRAVVDHMLSRYQSNTEAGTSGEALLKADALQSFVKQNRPALSRIFNATELQRMEAIAADLQRANRSIAAVKLPGGSNTAQDTFAIGKTDAPHTILSKIVLASASAGGAGGTAFGGPLVGVAAGLGAGFVAAMRQAGLQKIDDIIKDAMLNPDRAALLLSKATTTPDTGAALALAKRWRAASVAGAATVAGNENHTPMPLRASSANDPDFAAQLGLVGAR